MATCDPRVHGCTCANLQWGGESWVALTDSPTTDTFSLAAERSESEEDDDGTEEWHELAIGLPIGVGAGVVTALAALLAASRRDGRGGKERQFSNMALSLSPFAARLSPGRLSPLGSPRSPQKCDLGQGLLGQTLDDLSQPMFPRLPEDKQEIDV